MNLFWYPPAETHLPWALMFRALFPSKGRPEEKLQEILRCTVPVVFGVSGRALLCELLLGLKALHGREKDEVVIPGYTCYSVAAAAACAGLKIRLYDLAPSNLHPDVESLEKSVSEKTLAVVSQHLFGIPTPLDDIAGIAKRAGATHIEDAAQALGGTWRGKSLGTSGDFGLFSFGRGKPLPLGGGAALVGKDMGLLNSAHRTSIALGLKTIASCTAAKIIGARMLYGIAEKLPLGLGRTHFDPYFKIIGMPSASGRMIFYSDGLLDRLNTHRRRIAETYDREFSGFGKISAPENSFPVYTRYPAFLKRDSLSENWIPYGIRRMYPRAIGDEVSIGPHLSEKKVKTPGATEIAKTLITLPTHLGISSKQAEKIAKILKR